KNIIGQIITELLIVGTLGFVLASVTGTIFAGTLGNAILDSQTASSNEQSEKNFGRPGSMSGMPSPMGGSSSSRGSAPSMPDMSDDSNMKDIMKAGRDSEIVELDINARPEDYLLLFVTGYLVIILALIIPSVNIMRYQPKEILTGKE
ncbi:MAG: FtsX-like permease family protein, partial [Muribaculaceae bacterium]|nr:FtsX-like permease family protein [Muribaculaceae bacterium]